MPTLEKNVKAELLKRHAWLITGLNDQVIPRDAFFNHVIPFIPPTNLSKQDIVNILKTDEIFVNLDSAADFEVKVFAEILYCVMNSANHHDIRIDAHFANLSLHVDLSQSKNLEDILSGQFSLALQDQRMRGMSTACLFFLMVISAGLFYGGIRGSERAFGQSDTTTGDVFIGGLSLGALLLATGFFCLSARGLCQFVCNAISQAQQVTQTELTAFYEKHGSSPVSVSTSEHQHASEVPLLLMSTANKGYGSITM